MNPSRSAFGIKERFIKEKELDFLAASKLHLMLLTGSKDKDVSFKVKTKPFHMTIDSTYNFDGVFLLFSEYYQKPKNSILD